MDWITWSSTVVVSFLCSGPYKYSTTRSPAGKQTFLPRRARGERAVFRGRRSGLAVPPTSALRRAVRVRVARLSPFLVSRSFLSLCFSCLFQRAPAASSPPGAAGFFGDRFPCSISSKPHTQHRLIIRIKDLTARSSLIRNVRFPSRLGVTNSYYFASLPCLLSARRRRSTSHA